MRWENFSVSDCMYIAIEENIGLKILLSFYNILCGETLRILSSISVFIHSSPWTMTNICLPLSTEFIEGGHHVLLKFTFLTPPLPHRVPAIS